MRLDYSTYLTGFTKDELDGLGRLAGSYKIHASKTTIDGLNYGKREVLVSPRRPVSDWEHFKDAFEGFQHPVHRVSKFIEGGRKYFSIVADFFCTNIMSALCVFEFCSFVTHGKKKISIETFGSWQWLTLGDKGIGKWSRLLTESQEENKEGDLLSNTRKVIKYLKKGRT